MITFIKLISIQLKNKQDDIDEHLVLIIEMILPNEMPTVSSIQFPIGDQSFDG